MVAEWQYGCQAFFFMTSLQMDHFESFHFELYAFTYTTQILQ